MLFNLLKSLLLIVMSAYFVLSNNSNAIFNLAHTDAAKPACNIMEGVMNLHDDLMFFLVMIFCFVMTFLVMIFCFVMFFLVKNINLLFLYRFSFAILIILLIFYFTLVNPCYADPLDLLKETKNLSGNTFEWCDYLFGNLSTYMDLPSVKPAFTNFDLKNYKIFELVEDAVVGSKDSKASFDSIMQYTTTVENARAGKGLVLEATRSVFGLPPELLGRMTPEAVTDLREISLMHGIPKGIIDKAVKADPSIFQVVAKHCDKTLPIESNLESLRLFESSSTSSVHSDTTSVCSDSSSVQSNHAGVQSSNIQTYLIILGVVVIVGIGVYAYYNWL